MDSNTVIIAMLIVCGVVTVIAVLAEPIKWLIRLILSSAIGTAFIYVLNMILGGMGITVGINPITVLVSGFLGLQGIAALYIVRIILG